MRIKDQRRLMLAGMLGNIGYIRSLKQIITIYLFLFLGNELQVGIWVSFFAGLSVIATYTVGKHVAYSKYLLVSFLGTLAIAGSIIGLAFFPSLLAYALLGSIKNFFGPLIGMGRRVYQYNVMHTLADPGAHRVELMVIREWYQIGIGATLSYVPLLFIESPTAGALFPILIGMACATALSGWYIYSVQTDIDTV